MFTQSVSTELGSWSTNRITELAGQYLKGRNLNADQKQALEAKVLGKVKAAQMGNKEFAANFQKYYSAKDKDGLLKFVKADADKLLPNAVKDSFRVLFSDFGAKAQPKPVDGAKTSSSRRRRIHQGFRPTAS
jgi:hypothetical protein